MATEALITAEQYLSTHFEREPELVHGELVERPLPNFPHGRIQLRLGSRLEALSQPHAVFTGVEVRVQLAPDLFRLPDIAVWVGPNPPAKLPNEPPLLVVEISSPDDRWYDLLQKLEEYRVWGVQHIWLVEPELKKFHVYDNGSVTEVDHFSLSQFNFVVTVKELFA